MATIDNTAVSLIKVINSRIAAGQKWNDKWATHLFYYGYDFDNWATTAGGAVVDTKLKEWGLGVQYTYNPNVKFGLNYVKLD